MMRTAGLILSNLHDAEVPMLTRKRTMGAVPIGGRYRMVDFPLSGMVNAGLRNIFIIAHHNYQSLMEHIGSGKDWDLARRRGGAHILPPYSAAYANPRECYDSRLQSLISVRGMLDRLEEENLLCADCDSVAAPDLAGLLAAHERSGAPMTVGLEENAVGNDGSLHIWVAKTAFLRELLRDAELRGYTSFENDILRRQLLQGTVSTHRFEDRFYRINSLVDYYRLHIRLATDEAMRQRLLDNEDRPILTKIRNMPPVKYGAYANVSGSLIAEGCIIEGTVRGSVLFGGVRVGAGCTVENAVVLEDCRIEDGAVIKNGILDKSVTLGRGVSLSGHDSLPIFVDAGREIRS